MSVIKAEAVSKYYGAVVGVKELSFGVEQGEIFGFLGPNGAGKTTTIRLLMQLLYPSQGSISLFGKPIDRKDILHRERIGYLPGEFTPYRNMSSLQFLSYMAKYRSNPPQLREQLLKRFDFTEQNLHQKIKNLSHGNRQKLGIIYAMEHSPELIILDEPTLGLDPLMQEAFYEILKELHQNGKTIFLSSHNLPEVEKICHRVAIIREGSIVTLETIENLKKKRPRRLVLTVPIQDSANPPELPGTNLIEQGENKFTYLIDGDIHSVLQALAQISIEDILLPEPDLEDIFLTYYQKSNS
jgi:ABC-2 type transport system ATP-binding protein